MRRPFTRQRALRAEPARAVSPDASPDHPDRAKETKGAPMVNRASALVMAVALVLAVAAPAIAGDGSAGAVPFRATFTTLQTGMDSSGSDPNAARCDPPAVGPAGWFSTFDGRGNSTHLGRYSEHNTHCAYATGPTTGYFDEGLSTITAANGDTLTLSYGGTWVLDVTAGTSTVTETWTITGGTGRFLHSSGSGTLDLVQSLVTGAGTGHMTGEIAYDSSDRGIE
jgi:hypothetical protein